MTKPGWISSGTVAQNRKARHDYKIDETFEAGLVLTGTEVKSLRLGRGNIQESYAVPEDGALYLINAYIPEYEGAKNFGHEPKRKRKLLLHRREFEKLNSEVARKGMTLIPLSLYFNDRGIAKLKLGLARGKTNIDRRETIKERDWNRQKARVLRDKG
ncbi:MAG: SsrA-binding protein SmpB [Rhodospirillaceae bacterium]|jgi:SsrA-binding protein|nr:SsrA-binding protein SmpB [Rhodospirillaceae bacterium]